jgi:alkaline phosphatase
MNKPLRTGLSVLVLLFFSACSATPEKPVESPKNVIFMIGDGMGFAHVKAYRMYADDLATDIVEPLAIDPLLVGSVSTDSIRMLCDEPETECQRDPYGFTDSASSATAYATGQDTLVGQLSVSPPGETMATILESAKMRGKSTGLVATSSVTHASPAAFGAHVQSRNNASEIANQYFDKQYNGEPMIDVLMGGGLNYMQRDDRNLVAEFQSAGYQVALDRTSLLELQGKHQLGLFAANGMPKAWDRPATTPSLTEMTQVALKSLGQNSQGFFLMVEGSQIDWAAHDNSVVGVVSEMEDFIAAIEVVLDFARADRNTLVVVVADHETGGMSVGRDGIYRWDPRPIRGVQATPIGMTQQFLAGKESLSGIAADNVPFELSDSEIELLDSADRTEDAALTALTTIFNNRTFTGWSSSGHTGVDVPLYAFGPGSGHFHGVMQNEVLGQTLWEVFLPE